MLISEVSILIKEEFKLFHKITQEDIDSVPIIESPYLKKSHSEDLQKFCQYCLYLSASQNNSKECAILIDSFNKERYELFKGDTDFVSISKTLMLRQDEYFGNRYIVIHNHPSNSGFSVLDICSFISSKKIGCLIAVGNNGSVYFLLKTTEHLGITSECFRNSNITPYEFCKNCIQYNIIFVRKRRKSNV